MPGIEKIQELWAKDCSIDNTELGNESLKVPELYNKYLKLYTNEKLLFRPNIYLKHKDVLNLF